MELLSKLSSRQKARAALSLLGLKQEEKESLDALVSDTMGNPIVGAIVGVDAITVEELVTAFFDRQESFDNSLFAGFQLKLADSNFRGMVAAGAVRVLNTLPQQHQAHAATAILRLSEMDFPEFQAEFNDIEHFLKDGLLAMLANTDGDQDPDVTLCICENCSHVNYLT